MNDVYRSLERAEHLYDIGQLDGAIHELRRTLTEDLTSQKPMRLALCLLRKPPARGRRQRNRNHLGPELLSHFVAAESFREARPRPLQHVEALPTRPSIRFTA
jgi:hypothetical protein